ncbi:heavy metal translocating P-type ATPase [Lactobacillus gigeriorum]|uniref:Cd(2+)-exporting ATPase n=1 Tax=Lactobacillus gigeriorum DSM 23908 = CRBIP 24.85 TaxID=1423751 RepID=I7LFL9_9LACO|nr:heavy metal translocating P-type ATPase [Lactobacillus gigeriorum]KRN14052.1 P-ATPase superfamily P-type ATPase cadmium transporter [Lactobacillus gigeriorum DSM 23908 = CRBIP 24.85]CCI86783.1 P-ATPase superfamily P-type ATPase cadmium transporter [Lactobacillus gigeriorum DSM 23908 = CRBIP 24.85]
MLKNQWKFFLVLAIGVVSAISVFGFKQSLIPEVLIYVFGAYIVVTMALEMFEDLKTGHWGIDILAIIAVISTMLIRDYWATWMILVMSTGGESLEDYATSQADRELRSLLDNSPRTANKLVNGELVETNVDDLQLDDHVIIKPGEQVPVDGVIVNGESSFDQSSLTGESVPVDKKPGEDLMSGSINGDVAVEMKVTRLAKDSEYQSIVALVKSSQAQPAKFVKMADRYAVPFTIISLIIGLVAAMMGGWNFTRFAEVMVVASPCPLLIAAPVALISGMSSMSRHHIIIKSGPTIEKLSRAKTFAFDKTGTLTQNKLEVGDIVPEAGFSKEELQSLAASVEQQSSHIIATSLVGNTPKEAIKTVEDLKETTGQGVEGTVDGKLVKVGKYSFVADGEVPTVNATAIFVSINGQYAGYITFKDMIRPETKDTIARLRRQGAEEIMMLTGDHQNVADQIGKAAGVTQVRAELLPKEKIQAIRNVPEQQRPVVMTGDGVNDAPSLTAADVGIAMGAKGATAASESADAVIMVNDLSKINDAVAIGKHTMKVANIDVITAIVIVIILELIAATGVIPALVGAILQEVVDLIAISLALLAKTEPSDKEKGIA